MVKVAVIGAGMLGLSTAVNVQRQLPRAKLTIIADKFDQDTTSTGAGGLFRPCLSDFKIEDIELVKKWFRDSWYFYSSLATSLQADESGNSFVHGHLAFNSQQDDGYILMNELAQDFRQLTPMEVKKWSNYVSKRFSVVYSFTTIITQTKKMMNYLMKLFRETGGLVETRTVRNIADLSGDYDVVVNCCGLRSKELVGDDSCYPVKGHLVMLKAPWVTQFFKSDDDVYLFPHDEKIIVGGIRERDNWDLTPDPERRDFILSRAEVLFPQLKGAEVLGEWTGLRPGRPRIRLETEMFACGPSHKLPVVHNYGHGGHGISLAWGCGREAAIQVRDVVKTLSPRL